MIIPIKLQIMLVVMCLVMFLFFINEVRKYRLDLRYTLLWFLIILINLVISLFPSLIKFISNILSIQTPSNLLFLIGILASLLITYSLTYELSKHTLKIKELTQELGLLKSELEMIKSRKNNNDAK